MTRVSLALLLVACGSRPASVAPPTPPVPVVEPSPVSEPATPAEPPAPAVNLDIDSKDILRRDDEADVSYVKHVLLAWRDLAPNYGGRLDPRAEKRSQADAALLAVRIADELKKDIHGLDAAIREHSEDPGALQLEPYEVKAGDSFVAEFKSLALRLAIDEVGIVKTTYGYHVIARVAPPPPDPLQSNDILARTAEPGPVFVQFLAFPWDMDTKADAATRATKVLADLRAGKKVADIGQTYAINVLSKDADEIAADGPAPDGMKALALRLKIGESGIINDKHTWIAIRRVAPPKADPLESTKILARPAATEHAKVKHILLAWKDISSDDERGQKRTRKELDALVKATVAKLKKGEPIEPLMKELSEDPGSSSSGEAYDVTPSAGLVGPFKRLSLRLAVGEVGVVKTEFGIHIIQRTE